MTKPVLVIMAAGIGSRYGGLKQIDPVGPANELIVDYSIYDAVKAGFGKIIFIITKEIDTLFKKMIGERLARIFPIEYAYQRLDDLPYGYAPPAKRTKPWGTAHAVYSCRKHIDGPFAVINADDFYGDDAFIKVCSFLNEAHDNKKYHSCMAGYHIENTITENGYVARGVCEVSDNGFLTEIAEHTHIEHRDGGIAYTEDDDSFTSIKPDTVVSMNMWGFPSHIMNEFESLFIRFLSHGTLDLLKAEFFLPAVVNELLLQDKADVKVLKTSSKWYGVTYREDKEPVKNAVADMIKLGKYPERLWEI